jgi:hypothetical protein
MANRNWLKGAAVVLIAVLALAACSGKKEGGGSGGSRSSGKETPASDFSYDLSSDGQGIKITGYTGNGGKVVIPAKIEGMPMVEIGNNALHGHNNEKTQGFFVWRDTGFFISRKGTNSRTRRIVWQTEID